MKAVKPGEVVLLGIVELGCCQGHKCLLVVAIDQYTKEAVVHASTEKSPVEIKSCLEDIARELPYKIQRFVIDQSCNEVRPNFRDFGVLEQFLRQLDACLSNLPNSFDPDSLELVLNRVVLAYNQETVQATLEGMSPVAFREHFFAKSTQSGGRETGDSLNASETRRPNSTPLPKPKTHSESQEPEKKPVQNLTSSNFVNKSDWGNENAKRPA